eukprot:scaffold1010_cov117-Skeletonema_dohrnii-CCMP3373.AAC.15
MKLASSPSLLDREQSADHVVDSPVLTDADHVDLLPPLQPLLHEHRLPSTSASLNHTAPMSIRGGGSGIDDDDGDKKQAARTSSSTPTISTGTDAASVQPDAVVGEEDMMANLRSVFVSSNIAAASGVASMPTQAQLNEQHRPIDEYGDYNDAKTMEIGIKGTGSWVAPLPSVPISSSVKEKTPLPGSADSRSTAAKKRRPGSGMRPGSDMRPGTGMSISSIASSVASILSCTGLCYKKNKAEVHDDEDEQYNWLCQLCLDSPQWPNITRSENLGQYRQKAFPFETHAPPRKVKGALVMNYPSASKQCIHRIEEGGILYLGNDGIPAQKSWHGPFDVLVKLLKSRGYSHDEAVEEVIGGVICLNRQPISGDADWQSDSKKNLDYQNACLETDEYVKKLFGEVFDYIWEGKEEVVVAEEEKQEVAEEVKEEEKEEVKEEEVVEKPKLSVVVLGKEPFLTCVEGGGALKTSWFPADKTSVEQDGSHPHGCQFNLLTQNQRDAVLVSMEKLASTLVGKAPRDISAFTEEDKSKILPYSRGKVENSNFYLNSNGELVTADWIEAKSLRRATGLGQLAVMARYKCDGCEQTKKTAYGTEHGNKCGHFTQIKSQQPDGTTKWVDWIVRGYCTHCNHTNRLNSWHDCPGTGKSVKFTSLSSRSEDVGPPEKTAGLWIKTEDGKVVDSFTSTIKMEKDFSKEYDEIKKIDPKFGASDPKLQRILKLKPGGSTRRKLLLQLSGPFQEGSINLERFQYSGVPIKYGGDSNDGSSGDDDGSSGDDDGDDNSNDGSSGDDDGDNKHLAVAKKPVTVAKKPVAVAKKPSASGDDDGDNKHLAVAKKPAAVAKKPSAWAIAKKPSATTTTSNSTIATKSEKPSQRCDCKTGCKTNHCPCKKAGKPCSAHCGCTKKCINKPQKTNLKNHWWSKSKSK